MVIFLRLGEVAGSIDHTQRYVAFLSIIIFFLFFGRGTIRLLPTIFLFLGLIFVFAHSCALTVIITEQISVAILSIIIFFFFLRRGTIRLFPTIFLLLGLIFVIVNSCALIVTNACQCSIVRIFFLFFLLIIIGSFLIIFNGVLFR
jgi:hypothetical protein